MNQSVGFHPSKDRVFTNYSAVLDRIQSAAARSKRNLNEIRLIGVTKYVDTTMAKWLVEFGCTNLAESRPQALWEKAASLADLQVEWHLIGHLQRNKVKRTLPLISTMHTLDSIRILDQILLETDQRSVPLQLLLEINVSGDPKKTGMQVSQCEELLESWISNMHKAPNLSIVGLMGMGSLQGGTDQARRDFASLRELRDLWANRYGLPLKELSMGMSEDFEAAVEEGATMVRIGSILFADDSG